MWCGCVSRSIVLLLCWVGHSRQSCLLPPHPLNGRHNPLDADCPPGADDSPQCRGVPGERVDNEWLLVVACNEGYTASVPEPLDTPSVCDKGHWSPPLPTCKVLEGSTSPGGGCALPPQPARGQYILTQSKCGLTGSNLEQPGSTVSAGCELRYSCDHGFDTRRVQNKRVVCVESEWDPSPLNIACKLNSEPDVECVLPAWPAHGRFDPVPESCGANHTDAAWVPGAPVLSGCVILFSCDEEYQHQEENDQAFSICENNDWTPQLDSMTCKKLAPAPTTDRPPGAPKLNGCLLPSEAGNRRYLPWVPSTDTSRLVFHAPGSEVAQAAKVQCEPGYGLPGYKESVSIVCLNSKWITGEIPECQKMCPPLESPSMYISCKDGTRHVNCSQLLLPHTRATYQCRPSYTEHACLTKEGVYKRILTCKSDGTWSYVLPECRPVCGLSRGDGILVPTVIGGDPAKLGQFPWHAGLYMPDGPGWKYICGGSLISNRIVLTAAHCVSQLEPEELRVALGKYYRSWDADGDLHAKRRNVSRIQVPIEYKASATNYAFDIALLLLSESLEFNSFIMPVCMDINRDFELTENTEAYVVGWGETELGGSRAETLLYSKLDVSDTVKCVRKLPGILSFDKFCGNKNSNSVVEHGDSGGGMTAVFNGVHYLFGIVSLKFKTESVFTNVTWTTHRTWLNDQIELLNDS